MQKRAELECSASFRLVTLVANSMRSIRLSHISIQLPLWLLLWLVHVVVVVVVVSVVVALCDNHINEDYDDRLNRNRFGVYAFRANGCSNVGVLVVVCGCALSDCSKRPQLIVRFRNVEAPLNTSFYWLIQSVWFGCVSWTYFVSSVLRIVWTFVIQLFTFARRPIVFCVFDHSGF